MCMAIQAGCAERHGFGSGACTPTLMLIALGNRQQASELCRMIN